MPDYDLSGNIRDFNQRMDETCDHMREHYIETAKKLTDAFSELAASTQKQAEGMVKAFDESGLAAELKRLSKLIDAEKDKQNNKQKSKEVKLMNSYYRRINR
jgi:transcriptional regulator with AAA-type ATPase domain